MCGEGYYNRKVCMDVSAQRAKQKGEGMPGVRDDKALLKVLLERERAIGILLDRPVQRKSR